MNYILKRFAQFFSFAAILIAPLIVSAQTVSNVQGLFAWALNMLNQWVVPIIFALAFIMFLVGVYRYFIAGGADEEKVKTGQRFVMWSMVGFVLMFCLWGIINIFANTLAFGGASEPGLPQFSANGLNTTSFTTNPISSIFNGLLGGTTSNSSSNTGLTTGTTLSDPQTGTTYTMTSATTYQPVNGSCGTVGTMVGSQCVINSTGVKAAQTGSTPTPYGNTTGAACANNTQCPDVCDVVTGTCQPAGTNTYFCDDNSTPQGGKCADGSAPKNSNDQTAPAGSNGASCTQNSQCPDICNISTGTCSNESANAYACPDNTTFNSSTGQCSDGSSPQNQNNQTLGSGSGASDGNTPGDNTLGAGGNCENNPNACAPGYECAANSNGNDLCVQSSAYQGDVACGVGQVTAGNTCAQCSDGTTAADPTLCPASQSDLNGASSGGVDNPPNSGS